MLWPPRISERSCSSITSSHQHCTDIVFLCYPWANIKFCFPLGKTTTETYKIPETVYRNKALSCMHVFEWFKSCTEGCKDPKDDPRSGSSSTDWNPKQLPKSQTGGQTLSSDPCPPGYNAAPLGTWLPNLRLFEETTYPEMQHHMPEDQNPQLLQWWRINCI
jgi:hypothetical protein